MAFQKFSDSSVVPISYTNNESVSISEDSPSASHIGFFTGVRSLGKLNLFSLTRPSSFGLKYGTKTEIKYLWDFDREPFASVTGERTVGAFLTASATQTYDSPSNANSTVTHRSVYDHLLTYVYRSSVDYSAVSAFVSSSTGLSTHIARLISIRKDLKTSKIAPYSLRMEMNISNTSATGIVTDSSSAFATAMDLKNTWGGDSPVSVNSFFGVPWQPSSKLDTAVSALTIEVIFRPYASDSVLLWRRLSSEGYMDANIVTQNSFLKLELTKSPDGINDAFRFYIRDVTDDANFAEDFAQENIQASGLFIPNDVAVNVFDGKFHHLIVSWSTTGLDSTTETTAGAGIVLGYIDGFKLLNKEEIDPRLPGADRANGPVQQVNMFEQRVPSKKTDINYVDSQDVAPSGNNMYFGMSNYGRIGLDTEGDRGVLCTSGDKLVYGGYDGQIQHVRIWNQRFSDGSTSVRDRVSMAVVKTSTAGVSFENFQDATLTGGALASNLVGWWNFNELNTLSATDVSGQSPTMTGSIVGRGSINLYDRFDSSQTITELSDTASSGITRTFLYVDRPEDNVIRNNIPQGRIIRVAADGKTTRVGLIYYDAGIISLDNDDDDANLKFLWPSSGTTGDFGFSVTAVNNAAINVERIVFNAQDNIGRLVLQPVASGDTFNSTINPTALNPETNDNMLDEPTAYITSVGMFNDMGDLLAIGKLSRPVKKDASRKIEAQIRLDF